MTEKETYHYPAEWEKQDCVQLTWPHEETDWKDELDEVEKCFISICQEIIKVEKVIIVHPHIDKLKERLQMKNVNFNKEQVIYVECNSDDTWSRDHAFITIMKNNKPELLDFKFNAWGGKYDNKYDNVMNKLIYNRSIFNECCEYVNNLDYEF